MSVNGDNMVKIDPELRWIIVKGVSAGDPQFYRMRNDGGMRPLDSRWVLVQYVANNSGSYEDRTMKIPLL